MALLDLIFKNRRQKTDEEFIRDFLKQIDKDFKDGDEEWQATHGKKIVGYWLGVTGKEFKRIKKLLPQINAESTEYEVEVLRPSGNSREIHIRNRERDAQMPKSNR